MVSMQILNDLRFYSSSMQDLKLKLQCNTFLRCFTNEECYHSQNQDLPNLSNQIRNKMTRREKEYLGIVDIVYTLSR